MDIAFSIIERNYLKYENGEIENESVAKLLSANEIQIIRYGELNKDYFWIQETINSTPFMIMHPFLPSLNGTNLSNFTDPNGQHLFISFLEEIEEVDDDPGEGFVEYEWQYYEDTEKILPKVSFVKEFKEWNWIIGTGVYIDDVEETIQNHLITQLLIIFSFYSVLGTAMAALIFRDIKKNKMTETNLQKSEDRYKNLIETMNEGLILGDKDFQIEFTNQRVRDMLGYSKEELLNHKVSEFVAPEELIILEKQRSERKKGRNKAYNLTFIAKDGQKIITRLSPQGLFDSNNIYQGSLIILADITKSKMMEEKLFNSQKIDALGVLAGGIAHDFNNILGSILGNISLAKLEINENENELAELLSECEKGSIIAKNLTKQLLTFSKGGFPVKQIVSIENMVRNTASFCLRGSKSTYTFEVEDSILPVNADIDQIGQVIQNIIINAEQSMPNGGVINIITTNYVNSEEPAQSYVKITIQDHGIGIPEKSFSKIFDPYFSTKPKGNGLGLAVCYSIIKNHSGYITVESEIKKGTTFNIFIPASEKMIAKAKKMEKKLIEGGEKSIIVLEDNKNMQKVFKKMGKKLGYFVIIYEDGKDFLKTYRNAIEHHLSIEMVILDLTIPGGMGGCETIQKLREIDSTTYAVVSSGYSDDTVLNNYKKYGFDNILKKPFTIEEFNQIILEKKATLKQKPLNEELLSAKFP